MPDAVTTKEFVDPISGRPMRLVVSGQDPSFFDRTVGVRHDGCDRLADVSPDLDAFYCPTCGLNGRVGGAWAADVVDGHVDWLARRDAGHPEANVAEPADPGLLARLVDVLEGGSGGPAPMPPIDFQKGGYLQEVNRLVLHPLGMALTVSIYDVDAIRGWVAEHAERVDGDDLVEWALGLLAAFGIGTDGFLYVQEDREDLEGWYFEDGPDAVKTAQVGADLMQRIGPRMKKLGYVVQPVPGVDDRKSGL